MAYYLRTRRTTDGSVGEWQCVHHRPHPTIEGKRITRSKTFPAKDCTRTVARKAAEKWGADQDREHGLNPHADPDAAKQTFGAVAEGWLRAKEAKLKPNSYKRVDEILRVHLLPEFGTREIRTITFAVWQEHLERLATAKHEDGARKGQRRYAANTLRRIHSVMTSVMERARQRAVIDANPCRGAIKDVVGETEAQMTLLTPAEILAVADALPERWRLPVLVAGLTGVRANELWGLQRQDIDLINHQIVVQRSIVQWVDRKPVYGTTKTGRKRSVPVPALILDDLAAHMATVPNRPSAPVFTNERGTAVSHGPFYKNHFVPAIKAALPDREDRPRFHDLRHSYISTLIAGNVNVKTVASLAGHKNPTMTLNIYSHLFPETIEGALAQLDLAYAKAVEPNVYALKAS